MTNRKSPSNQERNDAPSRSHREEIAALSERIAELQALVADLKTAQEALEEDHRSLQEENQQLRREMTLANLIDDLQTVVKEQMDTRPSGAASSSARQLYERLPARFRFPTFFQVADEENLDTEKARRFLVRYLADDRLVQSGAYLEKVEEE